MNTIVIYNGKTGFTEKYGKWIAEKLGCNAVAYKSVTPGDYQKYDRIIYGGSVLVGKVSGLDKMKADGILRNRNLVVFAVGSTSMQSADIIRKIQSDSLSKEEQDRIPFFYFEGGINFEGMGFFSKMMLKGMYRTLKKKTDLTEEEAQMLVTFEKSSDGSDIRYIQPLIDYMAELS